MGRPKDDVQARLPTNDELRRIIVDGDTELLVGVAHSVGEYLVKRGVAPNQVRNVFIVIREVQMRQEQENLRTRQTPGSEGGEDRDVILSPVLHRKLNMLIPRLDYQARESKGRPLRDAFSKPITYVKGHWQRFLNLADYFEAIVAFHAVRSKEKGRG